MLALFDKLSWCVNLPSLAKRSGNLLGSAKWLRPGLVNFVTSFACCFLPKLACSIHTTWTKLFSWPLYTSACKFQLPYSERSLNDPLVFNRLGGGSKVQSLPFHFLHTEPRKFLCTWLRECCRQVEAEVISNSRNKLHQTTYKEIFSALYISDSG